MSVRAVPMPTQSSGHRKVSPYCRKVPATFRKGTLQWRREQSILQRYIHEGLKGAWTGRGLKGVEAFNAEGGFAGLEGGFRGLQGAWPWRGLKGGLKPSTLKGALGGFEEGFKGDWRGLHLEGGLKGASRGLEGGLKPSSLEGSSRCLWEPFWLRDF